MSVFFYTKIRKWGVILNNQSTNENIGKRITKLRKQQNLTQIQLAEKINTSNKHISEIERGVTGISIDMQVLLSQQFHCSIDYLIKGTSYESVDILLPQKILEILNSKNEKEINLLVDYLKIYERIHT